MEILRNDWTGLFDDLAERLSESRRSAMMEEIGLQLKDSALTNFGKNANGDMRPWNQEMLLSPEYSRLVKRDFATLERTEQEREDCRGTKWEGGTGAHLKDSFVVSFDPNSTTLTNTSDYASNQQNGEGVPRRPFFSVEEDGSLSPFMWIRIKRILDIQFEANGVA